MDNITTVGIKFDTSDVERGAAALDSVAAKGVGVERSLGKVETAARAAGKSIDSLGGAGTAGIQGVGTAAAGAAPGVQALGNALNQAGQAAAGAANAMAGVGAGATAAAGTAQTAMASMIGLASGVAAAYAALQIPRFVFSSYMDFSKSVLETQAALDKFRIGFSLEGGADRAARELKFIQGASDDLGLSLKSTADSYRRFALSAAGVGLSSDEVRGIFYSVSKAASVMGLSAEEAQGAFLALSQMLSKGNVQAEELRGQLGERMPGAFQIAAKAMGVTTSELNKMLEDGKLLAVDFLPKFAKALDQQFAGGLDAASKSAQASLNRMETSWEQLKRSFAETGASEFAAGQFAVLSDAMNRMGQEMDASRARGEGFWGQMVAGAAELFTFLNPLNAFTYQVRELNKAMEENRRIRDDPKSGFYARGQAAYNVEQIAQRQSEINSTQPYPDETSRRGTRIGAAAQMAEEAAKAEEAARKMGAAVDAFVGAKTNLTKDESKLRKQTEVLTSFAAAVRGLAHDSADYQRALTTLNARLAKIGADSIDKSAVNGIKSAKEAYDDLIETIGNRIEAARQEVEAGRPLTELERLELQQRKELIKITREHGRSREDAVKSAQAEERAVAAKVIAQRAETAAIKEQISAAAAASKNIESIEAEATRLAMEAATYGATSDAIHRYAQAKIDASIASEQLKLTQTPELTDAERAAIERTIASLERLKAATEANYVSKKRVDDEKAVKQAAEDARKEMLAASADIERALTDSFMRSAENGKNAFEAMRDAVKGMFNNMVLRPIVSSVMQPVGQAAAQAIGFGGSGGAGVGGIVNLASSFNAGYTAAWTKFATSDLGATFGLSEMSGVGESIMGGPALPGANTMTGAGSAIGDALPYLASIYALSQGQYATAALSAIGTAIAGPLGAAVGSIVGGLIDGQMGGETRGGSSYGYSASGGVTGSLVGGLANNSADKAQLLAAGVVTQIGAPSGGPIGGAEGAAGVEASIATTIAGINALFDKLGSSQRIDQFYASLQTSTNSRGGVLTGGQLSGGGVFGDPGLGSEYSGNRYEAATSFNLNNQEALQAFALDLQQSVIQALQQATDLQPLISDMLSGVDAEKLTQEQVTALLQSIDQVVTLTGAVKLLGLTSEQLTTSMVAAAGGLENFASSIADYYQNFYSDEERTAKAVEALRAQFASLGQTMPATREAFRALVEDVGSDLTSTENQSLYGSLIALSGAFAAVVPSAEEAAGAIGEVAEQLAAGGNTLAELADAMAELHPAAETLVDQWRNTRNEVLALQQALDDALGVTVETQIDQLRRLQAQAEQVDSARASIADNIFDLRVSSATPAGAVQLLKEREAALWSAFTTAVNPAQAASELANITIQRIRAEAVAGREDTVAQQEALAASQNYWQAEIEAQQRRMDSLSEQRAGIDEQIASLQKLRNFAQDISQFATNLRFGQLSPLNPQTQVQAAKANFEDLVARAKGGDAFAQSQVQGAATAYLQQAQQFGASGTGYAAEFQRVQDLLAMLSALGGAASPQMQMLEAQRASLEQQRLSSEQQIASARENIQAAQEQIAALRDLETATVDTSAEEITALQLIDAALATRESSIDARIAKLVTTVEATIARMEALEVQLAEQIETQYAELRAISENTAATAEGIETMNRTTDALVVA